MTKCQVLLRHRVFMQNMDPAQEQVDDLVKLETSLSVRPCPSEAKIQQRQEQSLKYYKLSREILCEYAEKGMCATRLKHQECLWQCLQYSSKYDMCGRSGFSRTSRCMRLANFGPPQNQPPGHRTAHLFNT
jgi:hypothetical protein